MENRHKLTVVYLLLSWVVTRHKLTVIHLISIPISWRVKTFLLRNVEWKIGGRSEKEVLR